MADTKTLQAALELACEKLASYEKIIYDLRGISDVVTPTSKEEWEKKFLKEAE